MQVFLLFAFYIAYLVYVYYKNRKRNFPPGPIGLPFLGYLPFMGRDWAASSFHLSQKYGEVFSVKIGLQDIVFLCSGRIIKEALSKPELLDRPKEELDDALTYHSPIISANGTVWRDHRRFVLQTFRNLGLGKTRMNEFMRDELSRLLEIFSQEGKPFNPTDDLDRSYVNVTSVLLFGKPEGLDQKFRKLLDISTLEIGKVYTLISLYLNWMRKLPFLGKKVINHALLETTKAVEVLFNKEVEEHKKTLNPSEVRDFTDAYLLEIEAKSKEGKQSLFSESFLISSLHTLYEAGRDVVRQHIGWTLYILADKQDIQKKIHKEIDDVIGKERRPMVSDEKKMPLTQSVIMEVLRWRTTASVGPPRKARDDVIVGGYTVPRGTVVLQSGYAANYNTMEWENPEEFIPYRFMSSDETTFVKPPYYEPFGFGKRNCAGESYAKIMLFLYNVSILQKFTVLLPDGHVPDFEAINLITGKRPKPHQLLFLPRDAKQ